MQHYSGAAKNCRGAKSFEQRRQDTGKATERFLVAGQENLRCIALSHRDDCLPYHHFKQPKRLSQATLYRMRC